jgi:hypothetical protein
MPDIKVGKFDILATYVYARSMLNGISDSEAKERGIVAAVMGTETGTGTETGSRIVLNGDDARRVFRLFSVPHLYKKGTRAGLSCRIAGRLAWLTWSTFRTNSVF